MAQLWKLLVLVALAVGPCAAEEWTIPALVEEAEKFPVAAVLPAVHPASPYGTQGIDQFQPVLVLPVAGSTPKADKPKKSKAEKIAAKGKKAAAKIKAKAAAAKAKLKAEKQKAKALKQEQKVEKKLQKKIQKNIKKEKQVSVKIAKATKQIKKAKVAARRAKRASRRRRARAAKRKGRKGKRAKKAKKNKKGKNGKKKNKKNGPGGKCGSFFSACRADCDKERASKEKMAKMRLKGLKRRAGKRRQRRGGKGKRKGKKLQAVPTCPPGATCILPVGKPKNLADLLSSFREKSVEISGNVGPMQQDLLDTFTSFLDVGEEVDDTILAEVEEVMHLMHEDAREQMQCGGKKQCKAKSSCLATCQKNYLTCIGKAPKQGTSQISVALGGNGGVDGVAAPTPKVGTPNLPGVTTTDGVPAPNPANPANPANPTNPAAPGQPATPGAPGAPAKKKNFLQKALDAAKAKAKALLNKAKNKAKQLANKAKNAAKKLAGKAKNKLKKLLRR